MTQKQIEEGTRKAVQADVDLQISQAIEWLSDYGLISWKDYNAINKGIFNARNELHKTE